MRVEASPPMYFLDSIRFLRKECRFMSSLYVPFQYLNFSEFYEVWCELYAIMLSVYDLFNDVVSVSDYIVEW
jgi:hypothetical protein